MSQTILVTTVTPATASPRLLIFESWDRLSPSEKNSCIGIEEIRSLRGTYMREFVWAPSGCLRERWRECIAPYLLSICRSKGNQRSLFGSRRKRDENFMLELHMLSHSITRDHVVPTVIIIHEQLRVARKAADLLRSHPSVSAYGFLFQPLEDKWELNMTPSRFQTQATHWLCHNCREYKYRINGYTQCIGCQHLRCSYCPRSWEGTGTSKDSNPADTDRVKKRPSYKPPTLKAPAEKAPAEKAPAEKPPADEPLGLVIMPRMLCIRQASESDRMATAGGYLQLGRCRYQLTAAHPFLTACQRLSQSQQVSSESSGDDIDAEESEDSCATDESKWIEECQIEILPGDTKVATTLPQNFLTYRRPQIIPKIGDPFIPGVTSDWSLIRDNLTLELIPASQSEHFPFPQVSHVSTPVQDEPAVLYGRTGQQKCSFIGTEAVFSLPGSNTAVHVWPLNLRTQSGDCGLWVVNRESKTLYGMVIACSAALNRTYVVPAHMVAAEIADLCALSPPEQSIRLPSVQYPKAPYILLKSPCR